MADCKKLNGMDASPKPLGLEQTTSNMSGSNETFCLGLAAHGVPQMSGDMGKASEVTQGEGKYGP